ncbi:MAG: response regulator transcription factor [Thermoleophilia bacterium]
MTARKILVVDDETAVRSLVSSYLKREGYQVSEASDGVQALRKARTEHPDLIVLDLMLPEIDGLEICRVLRAESDSFILMLTAKTEEADKLLGLGMGADDYITKPFSPRELVARVKAILRRGAHETASDAAVIRSGSIEIDSNRHIAKINDRELDLTAREFDILKQLAARPGMVFSREQLLEMVWGYSYYGDPRVVDVHVAKLRKKMEKDPASPEIIITVRGVGYKLVPDD